eukprot:12077029-Prorocentrum_lima.AAC.1
MDGGNEEAAEIEAQQTLQETRCWKGWKCNYRQLIHALERFEAKEEAARHSPTKPREQQKAGERAPVRKRFRKNLLVGKP